ncbi:MAG TPA: dihydroorotate dehydrogenase electron transfer subunit [Planctomycetaceae bacterium]|nr:dihydroorotate dehydrogenase electron transfer subunit [Blastopirellula sp.]HAY80415.1 dihydroorotate dehydrogenase electron transfer subunit [Planctomycetaceae bacterium]
MSNPLHAAYYADNLIHATVTVLENVQVARDTFRLRFHCPEMASRILPGQFLMIKLAGFEDPLIGRPLAMYQTHQDETGHAAAIDVVYIVKGKLTTRLQHVRAEETLQVWGPLGNGFEPQATEHLVMVAGGIGQTPFVALANEVLGHRRYGSPARSVPRAQRVTLCYGARSADLLAGIPDFEQAGVEVRICTEDGSAGRHGRVTDELETVLANGDASLRVVCCGPEPMMEAVATLTAAHHVPCEVSLETPMACGIGICFSCVAKVRDQGDDWDYKRTCVEGPVFDATKILW